jgi:hypothetical protein
LRRLNRNRLLHRCEGVDTVKLPNTWLLSDLKTVNATPEGARIGSVSEAARSKFVWRLGQPLSPVHFDLDQQHGGLLAASAQRLTKELPKGVFAEFVPCAALIVDYAGEPTVIAKLTPERLKGSAALADKSDSPWCQHIVDVCRKLSDENPDDKRTTAPLKNLGQRFRLLTRGSTPRARAWNRLTAVDDLSKLAEKLKDFNLQFPKGKRDGAVSEWFTILVVLLFGAVAVGWWQEDRLRQWWGISATQPDRKDGEKDGKKDGEKDGKKDGEKDGKKDGEKDGKKDDNGGRQKKDPPAALINKKIPSQELVIYRPKFPEKTPLPDGADAHVLEIDYAKNKQHSILPIKPDVDAWKFAEPGEEKAKAWIQEQLARIAQTKEVAFLDKDWVWEIKNSPMYLAQIQDEFSQLHYDLIVPANGKDPEKRFRIRFFGPKYATHGVMNIASADITGKTEGDLDFIMTAEQVVSPYGNDPVWTSLEVIPIKKSKDDAAGQNNWKITVEKGKPANPISFAPMFYQPYNMEVIRANGGKEVFSKIVIATQSPEDMEEELRKLFKRARITPPEKLSDFYDKKGKKGNYYAINGVPLLRFISQQFNPKVDPMDPENRKRSENQEKDRVYEFLQ